jgi:four helix bundle protein
MLHEKLRCYQLAISLAAQLNCAIRRWPRGYGYLADQTKRAMASVVLNCAEGNGRISRLERRRFFQIARSSVGEVAACLDLMMAFDLIGPDTGSAIKEKLSQVSKMLYGLYRLS